MFPTYSELASHMDRGGRVTNALDIPTTWTADEFRALAVKYPTRRLRMFQLVAGD